MKSKLLGIATQILVMAIIVSVVLLLAGIGVLALVHACIIGRTLTRGMTATPAGADARDLEAGAGDGLSLQELEELPCYEFTDGGGGGCGDCAVCLEAFEVGEKCRRIPACGHSFHKHCADSWLMRAPACPICRAGACGRAVGNGAEDA